MMKRAEWGEACQSILDSAGVQHFSPYEIADVGRKVGSCALQAPPLGLVEANALPLIEVLEWLRAAETVTPVLINSWFRDSHYNAAVGGVPYSMHLTLGAADVEKIGYYPTEVAAMLEGHPDSASFGIGCYGAFVHIDIRGHLHRRAPARW
jgi:hypothetical protein